MELYDFVDYFVIVEANKSHNGTPKDFIFEQNKDMFKQYLDKVIYVKVTDMPEWVPSTNKRPLQVFRLEYFQRNQIMRGLIDKANPGDKILVSDCDEIPNVETLKAYLNNDKWLTFKQELFYYYVNNKVFTGWAGTTMANFGSFNTPQNLRWLAVRHCNSKPSEQIIDNGGWHYSYMTGGDAKRIKDKVSLFAEKHLSEKAGTTEDIEKKMANHIDLYNREGKGRYKQGIIDISSNKPKMLDKWLEKYPNFIYKNEKL
jgi:beta-1,4-mannosyl-glycoprotein beta-1,4-N-acetylglucosaminyltransferase